MGKSITIIDTSLVNDIRGIVEHGRKMGYQAVNSVMISTYWQIGKRIVEEEQKGNGRADYGKQMIKKLAETLTLELGNGFSERYLRSFRQFYMMLPDCEIWKSRFPNLTWTHVYHTLRLKDTKKALWYLEQASSQMWSVRTLNRNIDTQFYERHLCTPFLHAIQEDEDKQSVAEMVKSPVVAEFLGFKQDSSFSETDLENAIISHLQDFLMEMGRGFAFIKRQQLIRTSSQDYYIDLVFYNVILKCYVLVDLKNSKITHQDVGQMDMYRRMYDELKRTEGDNPTIGIVLCSETDEDIARYSILNESDHMFQAKYMHYMPTQEELKLEIEKEKQNFLIQQKALIK